MTQNEIDKTIRDMRKFTKKVSSSKKLSREFLYRAGICTKSGRLRKPYSG